MSASTTTSSSFTVSEALEDRFREGATLRSVEYRQGFEAMLRFRLEGSAAPISPYGVGSAQSDAFWSGQDHATEYVRTRLERGGKPLYE